MRRIAVWNTAFLGDAVLTLPLIRVLHAVWPEAEIDFYTRGGVAALFSAQPELTHIFAYDKRGAQKGLTGFLRLARAARTRRYDVWIDAHLSLRSSAAALLSGARERIGYREAALSGLAFRHAVPRRFDELEEVERLLALLTPLREQHRLHDAALEHALRTPSIPWPELVLPLPAHAAADRLMAPRSPGPILGLNPGSIWPTKRWTAEGFARVAARAVEEGANVLLFAAPDEIPEARAVLEHMGGAARSPRLLDLSGKTTLPVLAALISRLQCYLINDSGPMHLAWAQHVPVTALFGPTVRALGFFPRGDSTVVEIDLPCRPCGLHGHASCPQRHFRCMRDIDPERVWEDVRRRLYPWKYGNCPCEKPDTQTRES